MSQPASASAREMAPPRLPEPPVTSAPRPRRSTARLRADAEAEGAAVPHDVSRRRMVKVRAEHDDGPVRVALAKRPPRRSRVLDIAVERRRPPLSTLDLMHHPVAGDDGVGAVR